MVSQYKLRVVLDFASAHSLRQYPGDCARLHGHNWKVEVEVVANELDDAGMAVDFKSVRSAARALADQLDHRNLNDIPPFTEINPTAENIAQFFYRGLGETLNNNRVRVSAVTIWETERACATYSETP